MPVPADLTQRASEVLLRGGLLPLLLAGLTFSLLRWARRGYVVCCSVGAAVGYLVGHAALEHIDNSWKLVLQGLLHPHEALDWIPYGIAAGAIAAPWLRRLTDGRRDAISLGLTSLGVVAMLMAAFITRLLWGARDYLPGAELRAAGFAPDAWSPGQAVVSIGLLAAAWSGAWYLWAQQAPAESPRLRWALALLVALGAAGVAAASGSFTYGFHLGAVTATIFGCTLAAWLWKEAAGPEGASLPLSMAFGGLLLVSCVYANLPAGRAWTLAAAWVAASGSFSLLGERVSGWVGGVVRTTLCVLLVGGVVGLTARDLIEQTSPAAPTPASENPYLLLK